MVVITAIAATSTRLGCCTVLEAWWPTLAVLFWMVGGFAALASTGSYRADTSSMAFDTWNFTVVGLCECYLVLPPVLERVERWAARASLDFGNQTRLLPTSEPELIDPDHDTAGAPTPVDTSGPAGAVEAQALPPLDGVPPMTSRLIYLDHLKAFLTFTVVMHHVTCVCSGEQQVASFSLSLDACVYREVAAVDLKVCEDGPGTTFFDKTFAPFLLGLDRTLPTAQSRISHAISHALHCWRTRWPRLPCGAHAGRG